MSITNQISQESDQPTLLTAEILRGKNKCAGISGLWVLNKIIQKTYPESMKKIIGAFWKLLAK